MKCNHTTIKRHGQIFNRGECLVTLEETREQTKYKAGFRTEKISKDQAWRFYEDLREADMIQTMKTTVGMFVKVLNYNKYQDPGAYESNDEKFMNATRTQQWRDTINKNDKNEKNKYTKNKKKKSPYPDIDSLKNDSEQLKHIARHYQVELGYVTDKLESLELYCESQGKDYKNYSATLMAWIRRDIDEKKVIPGKKVNIFAPENEGALLDFIEGGL